MLGKKKKDESEDQEQNERLDTAFEEANFESGEDNFEPDLYGSEQQWTPEKIGDSITGEYQGMKTVMGKDDSFQLGLVKSGEMVYAVKGYVLISKLLPFYPIFTRIRIVYIGDVDVGQQSQMKNYRIDIHKNDKLAVADFRQGLKEKDPNLPF